MLVLIAAACVVYVPSWRAAATEKAIALANEKTDMDIDVGQIYLSPFHHSPMVLYRAWKGRADLPLEVNIDSLFLGHRGQDTLVYARALRLKATLLTSEGTDDLLAIPIVVEHLRLDEPTFHSDSMIASVGVDVIAGQLAVSSPRLNIAQGEYPLHELRLSDAFVAIDLRETPPDTTAKDTSAMLMAFDVPDGDLRNVHFRLTPLGLDITTRLLQPNVLADVGGSVYDARRLDVSDFRLTIGNFVLPLDTLYGNACVDLNRHLITSQGLHARSEEIGARADLAATQLDIESLRVEVNGDADFRGSKARLSGYYDIDDETYDMHVDVEEVDLTSLLQDSSHVVIAGEIDAEGRGLDLDSRATRSNVKLHLQDGIYRNIRVSGLRLDAQLANKAVGGTLHLPFSMSGDSMQLSALTDHQFHVADFLKTEKMRVDYRSQMQDVRAHVAGEHFRAQDLNVHFTTDTATTLNLVTDGLTADMTSPMHVMRLKDQIQPLLTAVGDSTIITLITSLADLTMLDTLRRLIPDLAAHVVLSKGSPVQPIIERMGLDINQIGLNLHSDTLQTNLTVDASIPEINHPEDSTALRLPAVGAALRVAMAEGSTLATLSARSKLTDGAQSVRNLLTEADLWLNLERHDNDLNGTGHLTLDDLTYGEMELGSRSINLAVARSELYENALRADVQMDDMPLDIVDSILRKPDINLSGAVRAQAVIDGLPNSLDLSAEVLPLSVSALYKPYNVLLSLGQTPVVMSHNKVDLNHLPIYGADSTFIALSGGLDLNSMRLDVTVQADSFAPAKLEQDGPIPVYGDLATDIRGTVTGPLDSIVADVDVIVLPTTDITYPIDEKNMAQLKPYGKVNVRYLLAEDTMLLGGRINVDEGVVRYSPKAYPIMPFRVDSGSHVTFNGPMGHTLLNASASQKVKASVQSKDDETRRVDFITGVRVKGMLDSIGLKSLDFFLEAPDDEAITHELASLDEETREGLAATLLATGMYVGESNEAAQRGGYALSSIINSRINAAMANSKMGKVVDIDISSGQTNHAVGKTNDMNIAISKSFLDDRLRLTLGTSISDNPEVNATNGLLNNLSAEYKLTKNGNVMLRLFTQRDYNNILEGELYKSGLTVRATKEWRRRDYFQGDSINRTYNLTADAGLAYRSNNSIGPDLTLKSSVKNLLGRGETLTIKGNGAYYWALRDRHPGDPKKTDTYKFGVNSSLVFPYLHWAGDNLPEGDTRYTLGYQYENIAGGYGVHRFTGSFSYFLHSSGYVTHIFTPFSLSVVRMKAESDSLMNKAAEYPQLIKLIAGNEFVPSVGYNFIYNDYRSNRAVNTMLDLGVKESGNIINALYGAFGHKWDEKNKPMGPITFNQFVKLSAELRNKFNFTERVCLATRLFAGANMPLGNSRDAPLSEAFYAGGPNSMRAAAPYAYGPGNFYSEKYNQNFFHAGDVKLEANVELRFPLVWKLYGATFVDAGNVWSWYNTKDRLSPEDFSQMVEAMKLPENLLDGIVNNPELLRQIALGTGIGLRLDMDGLVIRFDLGVGIHAPYQTYKCDKEWKPDKSKPITTFYNIPSFLDAVRLNFGIGYPF